MKNLFASFACILFCSIIISAQTTIKLSPLATELFKNVKSTASVKEKNYLAQKMGFVLSGNKVQPFALDKDSKEYPFAAIVLPADLNKDGGVSLTEAFEYTKQEVARFYKTQNRIATEQAILNGAGADAFVLRARGSKAASDPALAKLYGEREVIDGQLTALRARKSDMQAAAYEAELEKLLIQLAQKDRQIRAAEKN